MTKTQQIASDQIYAYVSNNKSVIVNAVCGAGKTELVYKSIEYYLNLNKIVAFAIPRKDVVIEIYNRLKNDYENVEGMEFPDPYPVTYIEEKYIGNVSIGGTKYEKRECYINLPALYFAWWENGFATVIDISRLIDISTPKFKYYKYYRCKDIKGRSCGEYVNAKQLFQIIK